MRIRIGLAYWNLEMEIDKNTQLELALTAERSGLDSLWIAKATAPDAVSVLA